MPADDRKRGICSTDEYVVYRQVLPASRHRPHPTGHGATTNITQDVSSFVVEARTSGDSSNLEYKVYQGNEANCDMLSEGERSFDTLVPAGTTWYVLSVLSRFLS